MNAEALPLVSVIVLSFTDKIWTWWGITIMVVCLFAGYTAAIIRSQRLDHTALDGHRDVLGFVVVTLPAFAIAIGGHYVKHGWGALVGGVAAALLFSVVFALASSRLDTRL
jgi:hypothetical protein